MKECCPIVNKKCWLSWTVFLIINYFSFFIQGFPCLWSQVDLSWLLIIHISRSVAIRLWRLLILNSSRRRSTTPQLMLSIGLSATIHYENITNICGNVFKMLLCYWRRVGSEEIILPVTSGTRMTHWPFFK